jgi:DNA (cytosine-5)-methyltransferase 1
MPLRAIELCAGGGGQALGLEEAGFDHVALVEVDDHACATLRLNRPQWNVVQEDIREWHASPLRGAVDLVAAGVPCPPFSKAGRQLGRGDERDLFPAALRIVEECRPRAVMLENVRGLLDARFKQYRDELAAHLSALGYVVSWNLLNASDFGVPQLRPRTVVVAIEVGATDTFEWPVGMRELPPTVGEVLREEMASLGWKQAGTWSAFANRIAPTIVGGSLKHGGPDLGPTRAKRQWAEIGVDAHGIADSAPGPEFRGAPRLTVAMAAILQGFPRAWTFCGRKTPAYRQVGNAFPPPVARAVGLAIGSSLRSSASEDQAA